MTNTEHTIFEFRDATGRTCCKGRFDALCAKCEPQALAQIRTAEVPAVPDFAAALRAARAGDGLRTAEDPGAAVRRYFHSDHAFADEALRTASAGESEPIAPPPCLVSAIRAARGHVTTETTKATDLTMPPPAPDLAAAIRTARGGR
jgi:hypothetical protein